MKTQKWIEVRDEHNHLVCEFSPQDGRVRVVKRNGVMREARLPLESLTPKPAVTRLEIVHTR